MIVQIYNAFVILSMINKSNETALKIVFAGNLGAGKTSLLTRQSINEYSQKLSSATIGIDFRTINYSVGDINVKTKLWDSTAGNQRFRPFAIKASYLSFKANEFALFYIDHGPDTTPLFCHDHSLDYIFQWRFHLHRHSFNALLLTTEVNSFFISGADALLICFDLNDNLSFRQAVFELEQLKKQNFGGFKTYLIGCKSDLQPKVFNDEIQQFAQMYQCSYFPTSAKKNEGVNECFQTIVNECAIKKLSEVGIPRVQLHNKQINKQSGWIKKTCF